MSARLSFTVLATGRLTCVSLLLAAVALTGCATYPMMPTPVLYTGTQAKPLFIDIAAARRTPSLALLYVTDRAPATDSDDLGPYTASRSRYLAFGSTTVEFGDGVTWDTLSRKAAVADRKVPIDLPLGPTTELGRFPRIPYEIARAGDGLSRAPDVVAAHEAAKGDSRPRSNAGSPSRRARKSCYLCTVTPIPSRTPRSPWASCATSLAGNSYAPSSPGRPPAARSFSSDTTSIASRASSPRRT